jgi:hypothetical protein
MVPVARIEREDSGNIQYDIVATTSEQLDGQRNEHARQSLDWTFGHGRASRWWVFSLGSAKKPGSDAFPIEKMRFTSRKYLKLNRLGSKRSRSKSITVVYAAQ